MGRSTDRGGVSHPTLADRQQQQQYQQQWGPSHQAIHAFEMYQVCVAAEQLARFTVEQRREVEYYSLSSRSPPPAAAATSAAAAGGKRSGRKPNKKQVEKQQARRESRHSVGAARQQLNSPKGVDLLATGSSNISSKQQPAAMIHCSVQAQLYTACGDVHLILHRE